MKKMIKMSLIGLVGFIGMTATANTTLQQNNPIKEKACTQYKILTNEYSKVKMNIANIDNQLAKIQKEAMNYVGKPEYVKIKNSSRGLEIEKSKQISLIRNIDFNRTQIDKKYGCNVR
jgi:DNA/RNA endonuclease YhcR with UshA esterase domain